MTVTWHLGRPVRCIDGRLFRHDPQWDDRDLETDVGPCPDCCGYGCDDEGLARLADHEEEAARDFTATDQRQAASFLSSLSHQDEQG